MCGGSPPRATIYKPDTKAYDAMAAMQLQAMQSLQGGGLEAKQLELNSALRRQQDASTSLRDLQIQRANDSAANAARLAAILGPPPPDKVATRPVVGENRSTSEKRWDRATLRIEREPVAQSSGSGLNIA